MKRLYVFFVLALAALLVSVAVVVPAMADKAKWDGPFAAEVIKVKDGDTIFVRLLDPCPFGCYDGVISIRLRGIDAPEIHLCRTSKSTSCAVCQAEYAAAKMARARVIALTKDAPVRLVAVGRDKYGGRAVGDIEALHDGVWVSISATLLKERLAVAYDGGTKSKPWCAMTGPVTGQ